MTAFPSLTVTRCLGSARAELLKAFDGRRRCLEDRAEAGVPATTGLLIYVKLPLRLGQLEHERWRQACITSVHPEETGDVKIGVRYTCRGGRWQRSEMPMTLEAASGGAISMQDAEQRLLLEPTVAQHSLSLLRTKVLGVHPKDGSSPAVGWRATSLPVSSSWTPLSASFSRIMFN